MVDSPPGSPELSAVGSREPVLFHKVRVAGDHGGSELDNCCVQLYEAIEKRVKYKKISWPHSPSVLPVPHVHQFPAGCEVKVRTANGVILTMPDSAPISYEEFVEDLESLLQTIEDGPCRSTSRSRLGILEQKYNMHVLLNHLLEAEAVSATAVPSGIKGKMFGGALVDTHSVLVESQHADSFVRIAAERLDTAVRNGTTVPSESGELRRAQVQATHTPGRVEVSEVLQSVGIRNPLGLTVQGLQLQHVAGPYGTHYPPQRTVQTLLPLFQSTSSSEECQPCGEWTADTIRPRLAGIGEPGGDQGGEFVIATRDVMSTAEWADKGGLLRFETVRFFVRIDEGEVDVEKFFLPFFNAVRGGDTPLTRFLSRLGGVVFSTTTPSPVFPYRVWATVHSLNALRAHHHLHPFQLRLQSCSRHDLVLGFLLADAIISAPSLQHTVVMQYLYYMTQLPILFSPIRDAALLGLSAHPAQAMYRKGLRVVLCTDSPLRCHFLEQALFEEYISAAKKWQLSATDLGELTRNAVVASSFSNQQKAKWIGCPNNASLSGTPGIRLDFRDTVYKTESDILLKKLVQCAKSVLQDADDFQAVLKRQSSGVFGAERIVSLYGNVQEESEPHVHFQRIEIFGPHTSRHEEFGLLVRDALRKRRKYIWENPVQPWERKDRRGMGASLSSLSSCSSPPLHGQCAIVDGVPVVEGWSAPQQPPEFGEYVDDLHELDRICNLSHIRAHASIRLRLLENKFWLHNSLNAHTEDAHETPLAVDLSVYAYEEASQKDFYLATKVDTHIHAAAGFTPRQLLEFMKHKYKDNGDDIVDIDKDGNIVTLRDLVDSLGIDFESLTVSCLNVQADRSLFERFDNFNNKYNPMGNSQLRTLFLKTDNYMQGRYFAELLKETLSTYSKSDRHSFFEMRLSIYGRSKQEWGKLALWCATYGMIHRHNRWMVQIPRLFTVWKKLGAVGVFSDVLANIFQPLWDVSVNPSSDPHLDHFLKHVSGFDCVDNEAQPDSSLAESREVPPSQWVGPGNPPYQYWMYYLWRNITTLNQFRAERGMSTFTFRPHCGEAGAAAHLNSTFLVADGIAHGINLIRSPVMEYLYYLARVPLALSPLSNNSLFLEYMQNPFPKFFREGLNVSLSTDDPLQFHHTTEPLIEEYSVASKVWHLTPADLCEIARNSVLHSGFEHTRKKQWLGDLYFLSSSNGNRPERTHLDDIRVTYRFEVYHDEIRYLEKISGGRVPSAMYTLEEESAIMRHPSLRTKTRRRGDKGPSAVLSPLRDRLGESGFEPVTLPREPTELRLRVIELERELHMTKVEAMSPEKSLSFGGTSSPRTQEPSPRRRAQSLGGSANFAASPPKNTAPRRLSCCATSQPTFIKYDESETDQEPVEEVASNGTFSFPHLASPPTVPRRSSVRRRGSRQPEGRLPSPPLPPSIK